MRESGVRVGVDVGGTFTDLVAADGAGRTWSCKVPTTPANPADGLLQRSRRARAARAGPLDLARPRHHHGHQCHRRAPRRRRIALITTRGFRDVLEIARQNRTHLYRLDLPAKPEPLVPRRLRREITERVAPDGARAGAARPRASCRRSSRRFAQEGVESVAVCLLHAYANAEHEQAVARALRARFAHVSVSSEINAEFREYERTCTTVLNAAVMPLAARYLEDLVDRLGAQRRAAPGAPAALGGRHDVGGGGARRGRSRWRCRVPRRAWRRPRTWRARSACARALAFDMGGTTTDVCLIAEGVPETAGQRRLGEYPVRLPMVAVESIGAGGGSIARGRTRHGRAEGGPAQRGRRAGPRVLRTGRDRAHRERREPRPRLSRSRARLRRRDSPRSRACGSRARAARAAASVCRSSRPRTAWWRWPTPTCCAPCGWSPCSAATTCASSRSSPTAAPGRCTRARSRASAASAAWWCPRTPARSRRSAAWSRRCATTRCRRTARASRAWDAKVVGDRFRALEAQCLPPLLDEGHALEQRDRGPQRRPALRRPELRARGGLRRRRPRRRCAPAFEQRHRQLYGYATGEGVECVNLRVVGAAWRGRRWCASARRRRGAARDRWAHHRAYFREAGQVALPRYDRGALAAGDDGRGPGAHRGRVVDDASSIPASAAAPIALGNLVIDGRRA